MPDSLRKLSKQDIGSMSRSLIFFVLFYLYLWLGVDLRLMYYDAHINQYEIANPQLLFAMVDIETVLVLGAGASKASGFPTGQELVKNIYLLLNQERYYDIFYQTVRVCLREMAEKFPNVLKRADPLSVDAWLEHNPKYIEVGKVAIAIALLRYEEQSDLRPQNNWYQLLFKRLDGPFEEFQNTHYH